MYAKCWKRVLDFTVSLLVLIAISPVMLVLTVCNGFAMRGNPFFIQPRPGKGERIFYLIKFRSMTNKWDQSGKMLDDAQRLTKYGKFLRASSLDELPELFNILKGDMSIVGPRPQLVRDMVFMTPEQRRRHSVTPGLTGLAQVNGRNNITWEQKILYDLAYIDNGITFAGDMKIILQTVGKVFTQEDTVREGTASDMDFGDWMLRNGEVDQEAYEEKQKEAQELLKL